MSFDGRRREDWIATALLALLVIVAFANVVFCGRSLVPSDNINPLDYRMRGPRAVPVETWIDRGLVPYPNFRDAAAGILQSDPSREFLRRSIARGEFPFWDPFLGGGAPSFASLVPSYLFPPSLLLALLGNSSFLNNVYTLLLIFTAGVLTYFLLRAHELRWAAALAGSIAFMLSGAVVLTAPIFVGQPVALFSLPLLATARLLDVPGPRRAAQLALAFAFVASATFPPILLQTFGMTVVYLVIAAIRDRTHRRAIGWFAAGAAVALMIVAFAYVPAIALMAETTHIHDYYAHAATTTMAPQRLLQTISAKLFEGVEIRNAPVFGGVTGEHMYYTGAIAIFLAGIGVLARQTSKARTLQLAAILTIALTVAKLLGIPPVQWIASVPFLRNFHYAAYFGIVVAYAVTILAALGIDALLGGRTKRWQLPLAAALPLGTLLAIRIIGANRIATHPNGARWLGDFEIVIALLALSIACWSFVQRRPYSRAAIAIALLLLACEGIANSAYPRPRRWDRWEQPPRFIQLMLARNSGGRVLPMPVFPANNQSVFRLPALDSILTASPRMYDLYRTYFGPIPNVILRESKRIAPERVLDAANLEYFTIAATDSDNLAEAKRRGYETLHADEFMHLVRRDTEPRYSFTSQYELVDANRALTTLPNRPRGTVWLEEPPRFPSTIAATTTPVTPRIVSFGLNEFELHIDTPRDGLLVCSESNMPGWTATIDGTPTRILAANYAFRAIEIPRGTHKIRFTYQPPGWRTGIAISVVGAVICVIGLMVRRKVRVD
jgi:hypothetical protein